MAWRGGRGGVECLQVSVLFGVAVLRRFDPLQCWC